MKSRPLPRGNFRHLVSCQLPPLARGKALGESGGDLAGYETLLRTLEPETSRKM